MNKLQEILGRKLTDKEKLIYKHHNYKGFEFYKDSQI